MASATAAKQHPNFQRQHSISAVSASIASATSNVTASTARQLCSNIGSSASAASPTTSANAMQQHLGMSQKISHSAARKFLPEIF
jgi:hypothetical protein